jgi:hypothetical protein
VADSETGGEWGAKVPKIDISYRTIEAHFMTVTLKGFESSYTGNQFVRFESGNRTIWVSLAESMDPSTLRKRLVGRLALTRSELTELQDQVGKISEFKRAPIAEHVGWTGSFYVMPDGEVFGPPDQQPPYVAFPTEALSRAGTLKSWKKQVAAELEGQDLAQFMVAAAFLPPLLRFSGRPDNVGFELVGAAGTGKTTLQRLACSVIGGLDDTSQPGYIANAAKVVEQPGLTLRHRCDMPLIVEHTDRLSFDGSASVRGSQYRALVRMLHRGGTPTDSLGGGAIGHRTIVTLTGRKPISELFCCEPSDRLVTIRIVEHSSWGVFDDVPTNHPTAAAFAAQLFTAALLNHGHAYPAFLRRLQERFENSSEAITDFILQKVAKFLEKAGVASGNDEGRRAAEPFALVYAAGAMAVALKVLPESWEVGPAALNVFIANRDAAGTSLADQLAAIIKTKKGVKRYRPGRSIPKGALALYSKHARELIVPRNSVTKLFPDWDRLSKKKDAKRLLIVDGKRKTAKRSIDGRQQRVFVFRLP